MSGGLRRPAKLPGTPHKGWSISPQYQAALIAATSCLPYLGSETASTQEAYTLGRNPNGWENLAFRGQKWLDGEDGAGEGIKAWPGRRRLQERGWVLRRVLLVQCSHLPLGLEPIVPRSTNHSTQTSKWHRSPSCRLCRCSRPGPSRHGSQCRRGCPATMRLGGRATSKCALQPTPPNGRTGPSRHRGETSSTAGARFCPGLVSIGP